MVKFNFFKVQMTPIQVSQASGPTIKQEPADSVAQVQVN